MGDDGDKKIGAKIIEGGKDVLEKVLKKQFSEDPKEQKITTTQNVNLNQSVSQPKVKFVAQNTKPQEIKVEQSQPKPEINVENKTLDNTKVIEQKEKLKEKENIELDVNQRIATTSSGKIWLAFILALAWDILDLVSSILTGTGDELTFDYFGTVDTALNYGMYKLCGVYYSKIALLEYIPYLDWLPIYSISAGMALMKYKKDVKLVTGASKDVKKAEKGLSKAEKASKPSKPSKFKLYLSSPEGERFKRRAIILTLTFLVLGIFLFGFTDMGPRAIHKTGVFISEQQEDFSFTNLMYDIRGWGLRITDSIKQRFTKQVKIATGEYDDFSGAVDSFAEEVGLALEVDRDDRTFFVGQPVTIYSTLTGRGIDPQICSLIGTECSLNQDIELTCSSGFGGLAGEMSPRTVTFAEIEDSYYDTSCVFEAGLLDGVYKKKTTTIYETVNFDFITLAYQRADFVDAQKIKELEKEDVYFEKYTPVYTPGPVEIAFKEIKNYPLLVGDKRRMEFKFYIKNKGEGSIKQFKKISFGLPQGVELETCSVPYIAAGNGYEIDPTLFDDIRYVLIEPGKQVEFSCSVDLSSPGILNLNSPYTTDSFNVLTNYEYRLIEKIPITMKKPEYITELSDCTTVCDNPAGCECTGSCFKNLFISEGYNCEGEYVGVEEASEDATSDGETA